MKDAIELEQKLKNLSQERKIRFMNKYDKGIENQILFKEISNQFRMIRKLNED